MKRILIIFLVFVPLLSIRSQNKISYIEVNPYIRLDRYPNIPYKENGDNTSEYYRIKGLSWGSYINYGIPIKESFYIKPGIGYYRYSFNDLEKFNTNNGELPRIRKVNYSIGSVRPDIPYFTNRYYYSIININLGLEKVFSLRKDIRLATALFINNHFTISQYYHLTYNPVGSLDYRRANQRYFGSSVGLNTAILKYFARFNIGPSIQIPVYDIWKTDNTFVGETNNNLRDKYFKGVAFGISLSYNLK